MSSCCCLSPGHACMADHVIQVGPNRFHSQMPECLSSPCVGLIDAYSEYSLSLEARELFHQLVLNKSWTPAALPVLKATPEYQRLQEIMRLQLKSLHLENLPSASRQLVILNCLYDDNLCAHLREVTINTERCRRVVNQCGLSLTRCMIKIGSAFIKYMCPLGATLALTGLLILIATSGCTLSAACRAISIPAFAMLASGASLLLRVATQRPYLAGCITWCDNDDSREIDEALTRAETKFTMESEILIAKMSSNSPQIQFNFVP